jgi:hypothetical protein
VQIIKSIEQKVYLASMIASEVDPIPDRVKHPDLGYKYEHYKGRHACIEAYALKHEPKDHWVFDKVFGPLTMSELVHPRKAIASVAKQERLDVQDNHHKDNCLGHKNALRHHHSTTKEEVLE